MEFFVPQGDYYVVDLYHPGIRVSVIVVEG